MNRIFSSLLFAALLSLPQLSCAATITLDDKACGSRQTLTDNDNLIVRLPANPTTGYSWEATAVPPQLKKGGEPSHLRDSQLIGAGGITSFLFSAKSAGDGALELAYRRPWEKNTPPAKTCRIEFSVKSAEKVRQ